MKPGLEIAGLGKSYVIRHEKVDPYPTLRDALSRVAKRVGRRMLKPFAPIEKNVNQETFWALQNITMTISEGDRLGVIGRNGAGKSTLLKILSRITAPTTGRVTISGRVASLLEVGTGFHPELTGRENIYLNGAILGMSRAEIRRKFDEIVEFAEIENFLDTPVKRYSSGMYVRLAFAVSAHLEPEILIVDEVLAVGDVSFQSKCLGRMADISRSGRTIIFVSHNMSAVRQLCSSALYLEHGEIAAYSKNVDEVVGKYLRSSKDHTASVWEDRGNSPSNPYFSPQRFYISSRGGDALAMPIPADADAYVTIEADVQRYSENLTIGYALYTQDGVCLYWSYTTDAGSGTLLKIEPGHHVLRCKLPPRLLNEGSYEVELIGGLHFTEWLFEPRSGVPTITIEIQGGISDSKYWMSRRPTLLAPTLEWSDEATSH